MAVQLCIRTAFILLRELVDDDWTLPRHWLDLEGYATLYLRRTKYAASRVAFLFSTFLCSWLLTDLVAHDALAGDSCIGLVWKLLLRGAGWDGAL